MEKGRAGELFFELVKDSRSSPRQKSKIAEFIKKNSDGLILSIGDGGNDINMIKTGHVGIGIFGKEEYQAAYNSDYAISQFKYLTFLNYFSLFFYAMAQFINYWERFK